MEISQLLPPQFADSDPVLDFEADLEQAARALDLEPWVLQRLKHSEREITVNLPLVRDDGSAVNITGLRIQHSRANAPCIGPVLLSPNTHLARLRTIAAQITLQSALLGLRLGGAAGAIILGPDQFSERELRHVVKDYVTALRENVGPLSDAFAPENDWVATWMSDAITVAHGQAEPAAVVGKAPELGRAVSVALAGLVQHALDLENILGLRIAIQGFGRRARDLAGLLQDRGARITAIADRSGGIVKETGIDIAELSSYVAERGVIFGFSGADGATNAEILESDCDVLILAAAERQIGQHNAERIRARVIVELAQGAVAPSGGDALPTKCRLIPHLLAGAPELAVWSHEWQNGLSYSEADAQKAAADATALSLHAFDRVRDVAKAQGDSLRQAGVMLAVEQLATSLRKR